MKISLNLDNYEPLKGSRIKRVLSAEMPENLQESFAMLVEDVNSSLVEAFEKNPHSEELRNCAEFASIDQILNMKYADRVSAAADLGVEEDYFRYLNMLKSIVEEIFGESWFTTEITSLIMGDDPDVTTSVELTFAMDSLIARTLRKEKKSLSN